jgi:hypothetical protein
VVASLWDVPSPENMCVRFDLSSSPQESLGIGHIFPISGVVVVLYEID